MGKYIFLDRDGTINRELPDYVKTWEEFEFLPRVLDALRLWRAEGFRCFVASNQSCVEREIATAEAVRGVMERMCRAVEEAGGKIDGAYFCPHAPEISPCACRKPAIGLLEQAAREHGFDLSEAYSVGDMERDVQAGAAAGHATILVRTGKGESHDFEKWAVKPDYIVEDLLEAARLTVKLENRRRK